ncbi:MAG: Rrf2 family transcriptional regulator [Candidatus Omnitrophica bacterium]|nr:Rrf2 family transcriptional regulator [Candidatus Omnitrophota bacterium]
MKLVTRDTDYAIRALCYIAKRKKSIVSVKKLVRDLKIPRPFLRKILQRMNKSGLLKSYKGKGGGFELSRAAGAIFVADVMKIFQGPLKCNEHIFKKSLCPHIRTCALKGKLDMIQKHIVSDLKSISIGSLIKKGK